MIIPTKDWKQIETANTTVMKRWAELCAARANKHVQNTLMAEMSYLNDLQALNDLIQVVLAPTNRQ